MVNLLDTPGHEDFSEDTYRTLTAVDSALMVIDCAKGVEERTIKLMEVCRLRDTPIMTFINKLDREGREPMELLDEIEKVLKISCAPVTWPIGMGRELKGIYHLLEDRIYIYQAGEKGRAGTHATIDGLASAAAGEFLGDRVDAFRDEVELVRARRRSSRPASISPARQTPVFFGSAINNFGVTELLSAFVRHCAESAAARDDGARRGAAGGEADRLRVQDPGEHGSRASRPHRVHAHLLGPLFPAACGCSTCDSARKCASTMRSRSSPPIASTPTRPSPATSSVCTTTARSTSATRSRKASRSMFTGIPNFAPEMFRRVVLRDPLRMKALQKGLDQLCEEGATQVFRPLRNNDLILGAVGQLQFDVVAFRLQDEYSVQAAFDNVNVYTARWVYGKDAKKLEEFRAKAYDNLALDHSGALVYLAPTRVNLELTLERWPDLDFRETREHLAAAA